MFAIAGKTAGPILLKIFEGTYGYPWGEVCYGYPWGEVCYVFLKFHVNAGTSV